jgi:hypothetical protein
MFTKTMEFDDLDGKTVQQTFYFNFTRLEITKMLAFDDLEGKIARLTTPAALKSLSEPENAKEAYGIFEELILNAYGRKTADNRGFEKNPALKQEWANHMAFPELIFEMLENTELAAEFMEKCLPKRMVDAAKAEMARNPSAADIGQMVATAAERQADPATAMQPGTYPMGVDPGPEEIVTGGEMVTQTPVEKPEPTDEELLRMKPIDMTRDQIMRAMRLKSQG